MYAYAGNNPVRYTDPDGREILSILSFQHQNDSNNEFANIGSVPSGHYNKDGGWNWNTLGAFGCLFVCAVNIGNSINKNNNPNNYVEQSAAALALDDKYFIFDSISRYGLSSDFVSGISEISVLITDMTGIEYGVERYEGKAKNMMLNIVKNLDKGAYVIANVGGHFINVTGTKEDGSMKYFDPYIRKTKKEYDWKNIIAIYIIFLKEQDQE